MDTFDEITQLYDEHFGRIHNVENRHECEDEEEFDAENFTDNETEGDNIIEEFLSINSVVLAIEENVRTESECIVTSRQTCNCQNDCFYPFHEQEVREHIFNLREMEKSEKEFYILGVLNRLGCMQVYDENDSKRQRIEYRFRDSVVCKDAFCLLFDIGNFTLRALMTHIRQHGLVIQV